MKVLGYILFLLLLVVAFTSCNNPDTVTVIDHVNGFKYSVTEYNNGTYDSTHWRINVIGMWDKTYHIEGAKREK